MLGQTSVHIPQLPGILGTEHPLPHTNTPRSENNLKEAVLSPHHRYSGIELRPLGLAAGAFTWEAILLAHPSLLCTFSYAVPRTEHRASCTMGKLHPLSTILTLRQSHTMLLGWPELTL